MGRTSNPRIYRRNSRLFCLLAALFLFALAHTAAAQVLRTPLRVLVIYSDNRLLPANVLFDEYLRDGLASGAVEPIECCAEFLDEMSFPAHYQERMRELILGKYGDHPADVIVAFASPSLDFCLRNRSQLFSTIPIVFAGLITDSLDAGLLEPGVTGVRSTVDAPATLRLALRLHPKTRRVFVIAGPPGFESDSTGAGWVHLRESEFHIPFHILTGQPLTELLQALAGLPENSLVIDLSGIQTGAYNVTAQNEAMRRMSEMSRAPIYGVFDPLVGYGLVGAVTTPMDTLGRATAALVREVLARRDTDSLPAVRSLSAAPIFDWRQLRRWGLHARQVPSGSIVRFESPSFWRQHLGFVFTTGALILLQSGLILSLVLQSLRRRRAELEARHRREELAHMTRVATMGELTASLAHEINQPLAAILSNAQAAQHLLSSGGNHAEEIKEILSDIATDDQRAGEVIRRIRTLLRKGELHPAELDVNELVNEVVALVSAEMLLQDVALSLELSPSLLLVQGDRVQLQQVILNLTMNALDAMKETSGGDRRIVVRTAIAAGERSVEVAIQDSGVGIAAEKLEQIFDPFFTTKPHGLGLGLSICRSIIQVHGGRIGCRNNSDRGATFWFTLPALEDRKP